MVRGYNSSRVAVAAFDSLRAVLLHHLPGSPAPADLGRGRIRFSGRGDAGTPEDAWLSDDGVVFLPGAASFAQRTVGKLAFTVPISVRARVGLAFPVVRTYWFSWLCAIFVRMRHRSDSNAFPALVRIRYALTSLLTCS